MNYSNLPAGTYQITVQTGATCTATCSVILAFQNCTFNLNILTIPEICRGDSTGQATIIASGGQIPYSIEWSTGDTIQTVMNLGPGAYFVTVTDGNGCVANQTANLAPGVAPPSAVTGSGVDICADSCYQIPVNLTGTPPFTLDYTITNGGTPINRQLQTISRQDSILICPTADNLTTGAFEVQFGLLQDLSCDTLLNDTLFFNYLPPAASTLAPTICPNDTVMVGDEVFHANNSIGRVVLPGASANGCDSIINVSLSFFPEAVGLLEQSICIGDSIIVGTDTFNSDRPTGRVVLENASENGCDSTVNVTLTILPLGLNDFEADLCEGDSLSIGGEIFTADRLSGQVLLDNAAANGCDSLINVNLSLLQAVENRITDPICNGDTLFYGGQAFHADRLIDTIVLEDAAINTCDSILILDLQLLSSSIFAVTQDVCQTDTLFFGGQQFTADFLTDTIILDNQSANGCDSIIQVNLTLRDAIRGNLTTTLCPSDSLLVRDTIIRDAGQYQVLMPGASATGCDSLVFIDLSYFPLAENSIQTTLCPGDSLVVGDEVFTENRLTGQVVLMGVASNGCDSIVDVDLQYFPESMGNLTGQYCFGDTVDVGDQSFTADMPNGLVRLEAAAANGCDSIVDVDLTFLPASIGNLDSLLCFNDQLQVGGEVFDRNRPSGVVVLASANTFGCDSTVFVNTSYRPLLSATLSPDTTVCGDVNSAVVQLQFSEIGTYDFMLTATNGTIVNEEDFMVGAYDLVLNNITEDVTVTVNALISDDGCPIELADDQVNVNLSDLAVTFNIDQPLSCENTADGSISAVASGGEGNYSYSWSSGESGASLTDIPQGTYAVQVSDNSECTISDSVTLLAPFPIVLEASPQDVSCISNGTGLLLIDTINGGTPPFEYSIDNQFFSSIIGFPEVVPNLVAGDYTLFVQDARDCQDSITFTILPESVLEIILGEDETITLGDSVLLKPTLNFDAASWEWTPRTNLQQADSLNTYASPSNTTV